MKLDSAGIVRFWSYVDRRSPDGCWPWLAGIGRLHGYGHFSWKDRTYRAHRVAWLLSRGPIPRGQQVLHSCDVRHCCRPDHLFLGTQLDNMRDMHAKGRGQAKERHWKARLTQQDVDDIRQHYFGSDLTQRDLARLFGITQCHVGKIIRDEAWSECR
jgi:hypothetical protein